MVSFSPESPESQPTDFETSIVSLAKELVNHSSNILVISQTIAKLDSFLVSNPNSFWSIVDLLQFLELVDSESIEENTLIRNLILRMEEERLISKEWIGTVHHKELKYYLLPKAHKLMRQRELIDSDQ